MEIRVGLRGKNHQLRLQIYQIPGSEMGKLLIGMGVHHVSGQIITTSHNLGPQKVAKEGKSPYLREI